MSDYSQGKIYKITCGETGNIYIGSTNQCLKRRLIQHTSPNNKCETKHFINPKIVLIEDYPCETKQELLWKEREWMDKTDCVNKQRPITSDEEYREHKKHLNKKYYENNKENIKEKTKEKNNCDCGGRFTYHNKAQHLKTKIHKDYVAGLTTNL